MVDGVPTYEDCPDVRIAFVCSIEVVGRRQDFGSWPNGVLEVATLDHRTRVSPNDHEAIRKSASGRL